MTRPGDRFPLPLLAATLAVARKELVTSFRDRQTTLYTLVLPVVLYPFLFWCAIQASLFLEGRREHTGVRVGVAAARAEHVPAGLARALERDQPAGAGRTGAEAPGSDRGPDLNRLVAGPVRAPIEREDARAWLATRPPRPLQPHRRPAGAGSRTGGETESEQPDAVLYLAPGTDGERGRAELFYDSSLSGSRIALARVQARLPAAVRELRAQAAADIDPRGGSLEPFRREPPRNVAPRPEIGAYLLSNILPLLLVIMTVMGAFFPAVDLTCGERERRTSETTLLLPVPRNAVHLGKILAVCAAALLATILNVSALALSAEHLLAMLPSGRIVEVDLPVRALVQVAPLLLLFAFFVSSVLTGVAALARTFKEGQALLGPVQILFVLPALSGILPGVQPTPLLASIPVVNVVLCFKSLLRDEHMPLEYGLTALSLLGLSIAAIGCSLWLLSREALLDSERGSWRLLRSLTRSARGPR